MPFDRATEFPTHLSVDEARRRVIELCAQRAHAPVTVAVEDALDRVLAADIVAPHSIPPFANSAMDGYAIRGTDLPASGDKRFRLVGVMLAGAAGTLAVHEDECVRITTGAPLPEGADTVVIKERVRVEDDRIAIGAGETACANTRPAGEDYRAGDVALRAGDRLTAARLGVLASCGFENVSVARRPRAALLVTGDELVPPGIRLGHGQIHDSNRFSIGGLLRGIGIVPEPCAHVRDEASALRDALRAAAETCDVVITSGGVSAGEADHMPRLVAELGTVHFWKVRMKPGMPMLCGEIGRALVFALPGNPVSSFATFLMLVRPGLMAMQGVREETRRWRARLGAPVHKKHDRTEFLRARFMIGEDGAATATPVARQGSGMLRGVAEADCFVVVPADRHDIAAGDVVEILPLPGLC